MPKFDIYEVGPNGQTGFDALMRLDAADGFEALNEYADRLETGRYSRAETDEDYERLNAAGECPAMVSPSHGVWTAPFTNYEIGAFPVHEPDYVTWDPREVSEDERPGLEAIAAGLPATFTQGDRYAIEETVDGAYIVLCDGLQVGGGTVDRSGASSRTFGTRTEAAGYVRAQLDPDVDDGDVDERFVAKVAAQDADDARRKAIAEAAHELADAAVNFGGYADDADEQDRRSEQRDALEARLIALVNGFGNTGGVA